MGPLHNCGVESPMKLFEVEVIAFGTTTHDAVKRTILVLAETARGARRICKIRYRHRAIQGAREAACA